MINYPIPPERAGDKLRVEATSGLDSIPAVEGHVLRFVDFYGEFDIACTLNDLNRRYGRICKRLGTTARGVVLSLMDQGKLLVVPSFKSTWILSKRFEKQYQEALKETEQTDFMCRNILMEHWMLQGQKLFNETNDLPGTVHLSD